MALSLSKTQIPWREDRCCVAENSWHAGPAQILIVRSSTIMGQFAQAEKDQTMTPETSKDLRRMLVPGAALLLPGVSNALAARVLADLGFAAAYVTGAG